jgi:hypothetical protein
MVNFITQHYGEPETLDHSLAALSQMMERRQR